MLTKPQLIQSIYEAWEGVTLGDGTGLWEARMIDDYRQPDDPDYIRVKSEDERQDWKKLLPIFLHSEEYVADTWNFMDDKSRLFHLPCFLLQDLLARDDNPLIFTLNYLIPDQLTDRFKIFNPKQRKVILDFLDFQIAHFKENKPIDEHELNNYQLAREHFLNSCM